MVDVSKLKTNKIEDPATYYVAPDDIVRDNDLSAEEKKKALNTWEQDARQQLTASGEGMLVARKASIRIITLASARYSAQRIRLVRNRNTNPPNRTVAFKIRVGDFSVCHCPLLSRDPHVNPRSTLRGHLVRLRCGGLIFKKLGLQTD